jgi:hypothetical protein
MQLTASNGSLATRVVAMSRSPHLRPFLTVGALRLAALPRMGLPVGPIGCRNQLAMDHVRS